jgi:hypothetical protein
MTSAAINPSNVKAGNMVYLLPLTNTTDFFALVLIVE